MLDRIKIGVKLAKVIMLLAGVALVRAEQTEVDHTTAIGGDARQMRMCALTESRRAEAPQGLSPIRADRSICLVSGLSLIHI